MDFKLLFDSIADACQNSPILIGISALAVIIFFFLIIDVQRNKKKRSRYRWK